jgi:outer membrane lipoprotein-sorting protein
VSARRRLRNLLLLTGLLAGCATTLAPPREIIPPAARRGIDLLTERWNEFKDLRTLADVQVQRGRERQRVRAVVLARAPASVRFEALSPMGQPLLIATIHEGRLTTYDATTNEALVGRATPETTARVLGLPFEPDDLVAVLAGRAIPPADVRAAQWLPADDSGPSLELIGPVNRRRIWLDPATGLVRQMELTGGRAEARVRYLRNPAGVVAGFDVTAMMSYVTASVRYQNPTFDVAIDPAVFTFEPPTDAKVQQIP